MAERAPAQFRKSQKTNQPSNQSSNQSPVNNTYEIAKAKFYSLRGKSQSSLDENKLPPDGSDCDFLNCL